MNYERDHSHSHCFTQENPPCGIKGKHRCCLCEMPVIEKIEGLLQCQFCGKPFKKETEYSYTPQCEHYPKDIQISIG